MPTATEITLETRMRQAARAIECEAGKLDRRGHYPRACEHLRLADLLCELAWQVEQWETAREALKVPAPGVQDPALAGIDDKAGIDE